MLPRVLVIVTLSSLVLQACCSPSRVERAVLAGEEMSDGNHVELESAAGVERALEDHVTMNNAKRDTKSDVIDHVMNIAPTIWDIILEGLMGFFQIFG